MQSSSAAMQVSFALLKVNFKALVKTVCTNFLDFPTFKAALGEKVNVMRERIKSGNDFKLRFTWSRT